MKNQKFRVLKKGTYGFLEANNAIRKIIIIKKVLFCKKKKSVRNFLKFD